MMAQSEPELSNITGVLPDTLKRAASSVGAQSVTSLEDMSKEAASSTELKTAFQSEISKTLTDRIEKDPDYIPEKYPNSERVYKRKNNGDTSWFTLH